MGAKPRPKRIASFGWGVRVNFEKGWVELTYPKQSHPHRPSGVNLTPDEAIAVGEYGARCKAWLEAEEADRD